MGPGIRKPQIAERDPVGLAVDIAAASILDAWMRRRNVSNVELSENCGVSESIVRDWRSGQRPLSLRHLLKLPARFRRSLFEVLADLELPSVAA